MSYRFPYLAGAILAAAASPAWAAGFLVEHHGARAAGRADAVVATVEDGSAVHYNPAGLALAEGYSLYFGASVVSSSQRFEDESGGGTVYTADEGEPLALPNGYATYRINELIAAGFGVTMPFVSDVAWPEGTPGTEVVRRQRLRTYFVSPAVAFNLSRWFPSLTVGGGIDLVPAALESDRDIPLGAGAGSARLATEAFGVGGRLGLMLRPDLVPGLAFGAAWRSEVLLDFSGDIDFDAPAPFRSQLPPDGNVKARLTLPQSLIAGAAYTWGPLQAEVDLTYVNWRRVDSIPFTLPDGSVSVTPASYRDTVGVRVGGELFLADVDLIVRGGYAYEPSPVPARTLDLSQPDVDRHILALGGTFFFPYGFYVDAGVLYALPMRRTTKAGSASSPHAGTFEVSYLAASLSVGIRVGDDPRPDPPTFNLSPGGPPPEMAEAQGAP